MPIFIGPGIRNVIFIYPPASEVSKEVANLTERKIHIHPYMVSKNLSVCLSVTALVAIRCALK